MFEQSSRSTAASFVLIFSATTMSMSNMSLYVLKELHGTDANVGTIFSLAPVFELPEPGLLSYGLRSLVDRGSALYFQPRQLIRMAPWLMRFAAQPV